ncbi:MAG: GNAT family N-acetyltransferase, partial [Paracoccaceae bacterium]
MYTNAPTLLSENLILRGPEARDQEPVIAFLQDEDRAAGFGALPNRGDAWRWFALNVGHWAMHGYGYFMIETKAGETAGISGIWNPEGWPEPEVGWVVFDEFEGRSIAYEAACRVRRWAYEDLGFKTI